MEGNVLEKLLFQPLAKVPGGDELALLAREGGIVHGEGHFDGGVGNFHEGQRLHAFRGAQGAADGDVRHTGQRHDLTGVGFGNGVLAQAVELVQRHDLALGLHAGVMEVADGDLLIDLDGAPLHTADGDTAHVVVIVDGGNQQLKRRGVVAVRGGNVVDDGLEQRGQVGAGLVGAVGSGALTAGAEHGGAVELLVGGV